MTPMTRKEERNQIDLVCPVCKKKSYTRTGTVSHLFNATKTELMRRYVLAKAGATPHATWMRFNLKEKTTYSFTLK